MIKIIVTGSTGFIGSNLLDYLSLNKKYKIFLINRKGVTKKNKNIYYFKYDGKINNLIKFFKKSKPDIVIHLATNFISNHNENQISELISSNILFGNQILEAMSQSNCKNIINFGTYFQKYKTYTYNPVNLYAATKEAFEKILKYYYEIHKISNITLIIFDTYGIKDKRKKLIDTLIVKSLTGKSINLTDGKQILDLTYIDNIILNIEFSLKYLFLSKKNISKNFYITGHRYSIRKIVSLISNVSKKKIKANFGIIKNSNRNLKFPIVVKKNMTPPWDNEIKKISFENNIKKIINFYEQKK